MSRIFGYLFVFAFLAGFVGVGFVMLGMGVYGIIQSERSATWPVTRGEIETCKTHRYRDSEGSSYGCEVDYHYEVEGRHYQGDRIAFGYSNTNNERPHKQIERRLKESRYVQVHYNPNDPSQSVLATGSSNNTWLPVVFGTTWLMICGGIGAVCFCGGSVEKIPARLTELNHSSPLKNR